MAPDPFRPAPGWYDEPRGAAPGGRRGLLAALLALGAGAGGAAGLHAIAATPFPDPGDPRVSLAAIERAVFRERPLAEITAAELAPRLTPAPRAVVLFDVRGAAEHAAGHIPGSVQVSPFVSPEAFLATQAEALAGRAAVFADLAGLASGALVARLRQAAPSATWLRLRGGVLRWWAGGGALAGGGVVLLPDARWQALAERVRPR